MKNLSRLPAGLFSGTAGLALSLAAGINAGLIDDTTINRLHIQDCLSMSTDSLNLASGIAGQGIAIMQCREHLDNAASISKLKDIADKLLDKQHKDGSWLLIKKGVQEKGIKLFGLFEGIAGIICFLLKYGKVYAETDALAAAKRGLDYLTKQAKIVNEYYIWQVNPTNKIISPGLADGYTGIAFIFIKAYEVFKEERYKVIAESALNNHPEFVLSNYLNLSHGLAGLGMVYLEAYRVFGTTEWKKRADWIACTLVHTAIGEKEELIYWLQDHSAAPVADLMYGNAGIIQFLLAYSHPDRPSLPVFN